MNDVLSKNLSVAEKIVSEYNLNVDYFDNDVLIVVGDDYLNNNFDEIFLNNFYGVDAESYDDMWGECKEAILVGIEYLFEDSEELNSIVKRIVNDSNFVSEYKGVGYGVVLELGNYDEDYLTEKLVDKVGV